MYKSRVIEAERQFEAVRQMMFQPEFQRKSAYRLLEFIEYLRNKNLNPVPYLLRLEDALPSMDDPRFFVGTDPSDLAPLYMRLKELQSDALFVKSSGFSNFIDSLKRHLVMLSAFVGDYQAIIGLAKGEAVQFGSVGDNEGVHPTLVFVDRRELLRKVLDYSEIRGNVKSDIHHVLHFWKSRFDHSHLFLYIPVQESGKDGLLRCINLENIAPHALPYDKVKTDVAVLGAVNASDNIADIPMSVARMELNRFALHLSKSFFKALVHFELGHILHDGDSSQLAITVLMFSGILHSTDQMEQYFPRPEIVFTGAISDSGEVLDVAEGSIEAKVNAAFFSWAEGMAVPSSQVDLFKGFRDKLQAKYPNRRLEIHPISVFQDFLYDRRLSEYRKHNTIGLAAKKVWKRRGVFSSSVTIAILLLIIFRLAYGPLDKNPVTIDFEGFEMVLKNIRGQEVNRIELTEQTHRVFRAGHLEFPFYTLMDVFGDGQNYLIYSELPQDSRDISYGFLRAVHPNTLDVLWEIPGNFTIHYPRKPEAGSNFIATHIHPYKNDLIIVFSERIYFTSLILRVNARTGELSSEKYVHIGGIEISKIVDNTLYISGASNAFRTGFIAALDLENLDGHGPLTPDYQMEGFGRGSEIAYMLIPHTKLGLNYRLRHPRTSFRHIDINSSRNEIQFGVFDAVLENNTRIDYHLYTNMNLVPKRIGTKDAFDQTMLDLVNEGVLSQTLDFEYFDHFIHNEIKYLFEDRWVNLSEYLQLTASD